MNISNVLVQLTGDDILSVINDFVKIDGLDLSSVIIDNGIHIKGSFKKVIKINFEGTISDMNVIDEKVHCRFSSFKVYKLGLFRVFRSLGVKIALKFIGDLGFEGTKDKLIIDVDKVLEDVKIIKLKVKDFYIKGDRVFAEVKDINLNLKGNTLEEKSKEKETLSDTINKEESKEGSKETAEEVAAEVVEEEVSEEETEELEALLIEEKKEDFYNKGRDFTKEKLDEKLPPKAKPFSEYLLVVPDLIALIVRLLKDERVPMKTKLTVSGSIAYIAFPNDLIPSKIPFIGTIDDIAVLFFALNRIAKDVPLKVLVENWSGKNELLIVLKEGLDYVINFTGAKNLEKIFSVIEELQTL
ncbi:DUF1232 domain-containing protein [Clostridium thermobutyricum]|uniref:YkvA family protein n=1 Tax=Clostridium thermobutyricum TaxID=29372 RepID=UPI0029429D72|nr:DUF1232 domain-containing protein [Clostridium thermobutyricum]